VLLDLEGLASGGTGSAGNPESGRTGHAPNCLITVRRWERPDRPGLGWLTAALAVAPYVPIGARINPAILRTIEDASATVLLVSTCVSAPDNPDQPPRQFALSPSTRAATAAWVDTQPVQRALAVAAWFVPPVVSVVPPNVRPPAALWTAWIPPSPLPPRPVTMAPLTLTYGDQPMPVAPLSPVEMRQIAGSWPTTWDAQTGPKNASWNVPPLLISLPYVPRQAAIWTAWEPLPHTPPRPIAIALLTLTYGAQPPRQPALDTVTLGQIVSMWVQAWDAQAGPKCAAWYVPPVPVVESTIVLTASSHPRGLVSSTHPRGLTGPTHPRTLES
jgi:hypothetical protein